MRRTEQEYRAFLTATRNAVRGGVVDSTELRSAFDEGAPVAFVAERIRGNRSVIFRNLPLSTTPCEFPIQGYWS